MIKRHGNERVSTSIKHKQWPDLSKIRHILTSTIEILLYTYSICDKLINLYKSLLNK